MEKFSLITIIKNSFLQISLVLSIVFLVGCGETTQSIEKKSATAVRIYEVLPSQATTSSYTGVVHAKTESNLGFRVSGKILTRNVNAGDKVKQGQVLMQLDDTDYRLALNIAKANIEAAKADVTRAQAEEKRLAKLVETKVVSNQTYEIGKAIYDSSVATLKSLQLRAEQIANEVEYTQLMADKDGVILDTFAEVGQVVTAGQVVLQLAHDDEREALIYLP